MEKGGLKVNADTSKMMVLGGEEESVCEFITNGKHSQYILEFQ